MARVKRTQLDAPAFRTFQGFANERMPQQVPAEQNQEPEAYTSKKV